MDYVVEFRKATFWSRIRNLIVFSTEKTILQHWYNWMQISLYIFSVNEYLINLILLRLQDYHDNKEYVIKRVKMWIDLY